MLNGHDSCRPIRSLQRSFVKQYKGSAPAFAVAWREAHRPHRGLDIGRCASLPPIAVGDPFPLDEANVGDCSATKVDGCRIFLAACVLDENHAGRHVASDGEKVVEAWD